MRRKKVFLFVFLVVLFFGFLNIEKTFAQAPESTTGSPSAGDVVIKTVVGALGAVIATTAPILAVVAFVGHLITALIVGLASFFFNTALDIGVLGISQIATSSAIKTSWEIFRNLGNIALVFILLFIAITTILRVQGYEGKKLLGRVIIAAVLMNFSFFFGSVIVDVSNVMSLNIYDEIKKVTGAKPGHENTGLGGYLLFSKANPAALWLPILTGTDPNVRKTYLQTVKDNLGLMADMIPGINTVKYFFTGNTKATLIISGFTFSTILNLVVATVLFIAAAMIIGRLIAILLLLVMAPIAFVGMILPKTEKISKDWWQSIIGQSFFLPIFLLFIFVIVKILETDTLFSLTNSVGEFITPEVNSGFDLSGIVRLVVFAAVPFAIIIGLFITALKMAKQVSEQGSALVGKISASVTSNVGGAVLGGTALIGRNTIGAAANKLKDNEKLKEFARNNPILGSMALRGLEGTAKSSFDARTTKTFKGVASATGVGKDFDGTFKSGKDGFVGQTERLGKSIEKTLNAIPDREDTHPAVIAHKTNYDRDKADLAAKEAALKALDKKVSAGTMTKTHSSYIAAEAAKNAAKTAFDASENAYKEAKNPVKHKFVNTPPPLSGPNAWVNNVANIWVGEAKEKAKKKIKHIKTDAERQNEELLKAIRDIAKEKSGT